MDPKQSVNQIKILHGALFIGIVSFAGVCIMIHYFLFDTNPFQGILPEQTLYFVILIAGAILFLSNYVYKKNIGAIDSELSLENKLSKFRGAGILRVALIESAALIIGVGYLFTGDILYLVLLAVPIAYFVYTFPKEQNLIQELELTYVEQRELGIMPGVG